MPQLIWLRPVCPQVSLGFPSENARLVTKDWFSIAIEDIGQKGDPGVHVLFSVQVKILGERFVAIVTVHKKQIVDPKVANRDNFRAEAAGEVWFAA